jgi:hypothetical protein
MPWLACKHKISRPLEKRKKGKQSGNKERQNDIEFNYHYWQDKNITASIFFISCRAYWATKYTAVAKKKGQKRICILLDSNNKTRSRTHLNMYMAIWKTCELIPNEGKQMKKSCTRWKSSLNIKDMNISTDHRKN